MSRRTSLLKRSFPVLIIVLAAVGMYGILPQFASFSSSLEAMRQADPSWLVAAVVANIFTYICATGIYMSLALKKLRFGPTFLVQLAGLLINRVLPAGIGGLGLNFLYLRAHKHGTVQAGTVVALNNGLGVVGHLLLLLVLSVFGVTTAVHWEVTAQQLLMASVVILALVLAVLLAARIWRKPVRRAWKQLRATARLYKRQPRKLVIALLFSCGLTLANVLSLWLCVQALDIQLSFYTIFLLYSAGVAVGTAVPTPGGLGGLEAAIVAGMVTQNVTAALALAAVLLYRLLSFWLGMLIGAMATTAMQYSHQLRPVATAKR